MLVSPNMAHLEKVKFVGVMMPARVWEELVASLLRMQQSVHVTLIETNIDCDILSTIRDSPRFTLIKESDQDEFLCWKHIEFCT